MKIVREPVYYQIVQHLKELLLTGKYPRGNRFLTEREIAELFDVSRITANKALSALVSEGLLSFKKGVGTFVESDHLENDLSSLVSFTARAKALGLHPGTIVRVFEKRNIQNEAIDFFISYPPPVDSQLYYIERIRLASELPVIFERRYLMLPERCALDKAKLEGSLYNLIKKYRISITTVEQQINAVILPDDDAKALNVSAKSAALEIRSIAFYANKQPLWQERTLYRADMYAFSNSIDLSKGKINTTIKIK